MSVSYNPADTSMVLEPTVEIPSVAPNSSATAAVAATTAATTAATPSTEAAPPAGTTTTASTAVVAAKSSRASPPTVRIYVDTANLPRPVIVNYRQLYKRELKKLQERDLPGDAALQQSCNQEASDSAEDAFYKELLKKAEAYNKDDEDVNDDESDDENPGNESRRRDDYDFEDPFIDDSDMLMDEPIDYSAPEYDGFFVWHGPLDGHEATEKKTSASASASTSTTKRKAPAKSKAAVSNTSSSSSGNKKDSGSGAAAGSGGEKSRKKAVATSDSSADDKKKPSNAVSTSSSTSSAAAKPKKSAITPVPATSSNTATKKASATPDKAPKKKAKLDNQPIKAEEVSHQPNANSPAPPTVGSANDAAIQPASATADKTKKKSGAAPAVLKPLDPDIEVLMEKLRHDVKFEDFTNKAKFPAALKPTVLQAGLITLRKIRVIDDNLVFHLMNILPYNKFTLKKFLTTKSGQLRVDELQEEIDELVISLKKTVDLMMPEQRRLFNEKVAQAQASTESSNPDEEEGTPIPKFKCNDEIRKILYEIIQSEEQSIHIANQVALHKDSEKKTEGLATDSKARKLMYQRLLPCWPAGWMNSYEMSRQYSQYKSKVSSMSEKKNANPSLPTTPKANISTVETKKRKRATPTNSTSTEVPRKKQSVVAGIAHTPTSAFPNVAPSTTTEPPQPLLPTPPKTNPSNIITIDDDGDDGQPSSWKQSNSMKIEALISGPSSEKKD